MGKQSVQEQYATSGNLNARIELHERFSTNKTNWYEWYLKEMNLPADARILDVGCGTAKFWSENNSRVPDSIHLTLVDASEGMIAEAKASLGAVGRRAEFLTANVCSLPFLDEHFDIVMANHMLYHLEDADRKKAIKELSRVLKKGGTFFASTIGESHLRGIPELLSAFDPSLDYGTEGNYQAFSLQNGEKQLSTRFSNLKIKRFDCDLSVTEGLPIVQYVQSTMSPAAAQLKEQEKAEQFTRFLNRMIEKDGPLLIRKETGYFSGMKKA